ARFRTIGGSADSDEPIGPPRFAVEEHTGSKSQRPIQLLIERDIELLGVDAQFFQELFRVLTVSRGRLNRLGAAVADEHAAAGGKLVALRVPAKVIVVVDDKHARVATGKLSESVCRRQAADASSDNNQIICFTQVDSVGVPDLSIAQRVTHFEGTGVAP